MIQLDFRANQKPSSDLIYCFDKAADVLCQDLVRGIKILLNSYQSFVKIEGSKY